MPILPQKWQYLVSASTKKQFGILQKLMHRPDVDSIVNSCDSGREGELIFRLVYQQAGCKKPFSRLWLSSMEEAAIREGFAHLKPSTEYDALTQKQIVDGQNIRFFHSLEHTNQSLFGRAAAALEAGKTGLVWDCPGYCVVDGQVFRCAGGVPHGEVDLAAALQKSCNGYFIRLGQELGPERVREMAVRLGFGRALNLADTLSTAAGQLPETETLTSSGAFANFCFGQGDLVYPQMWLP